MSHDDFSWLFTHRNTAWPMWLARHYLLPKGCLAPHLWRILK